VTYPDTSFVVALFVYETRSAEAQRLMTVHAGQPWFTPLHAVEWEHAIAQNVRLGQASPAEAARWRDHLAEDLRSGRWLQTGLPSDVWTRSASLARILGPLLPMRTLDTLHVMAALDLGATDFWTFDAQQARLARRVGLHVLP
jgi:predicted nucleic acid-binding protein